jgi:elongation factor Ts
VNKDAVDQATIDHELQIGREQALAEGKPEQIVDKIAQGKLNKFFQENTLLAQKFVKDNSMTVEQYLNGSAERFNCEGIQAYRHRRLIARLNDYK